MPKLFSAAPNVTGQIQSRAVTPNTFGGSGLQEAGKQITSFADLMQKRIETDEISEVNKELSQKRVEWTQNLYDSAENMESGGAGFTENVVKNFEDFSFENPYKTQAAQRAWSQGLASMRSDLTVRSIGIESEARGKKAVADYSTTSQNNQSVVTQDPTQLDSVLKAQLAYIETLPLSAANKTEFSESAGTDLAEAAVRGMIRSNPDLAKQNLKDGVFSKFFDSDETKRLIGEANTAESAIRIQAERDEQAAEDSQVVAQKAAKRKWLLALNSDTPPRLEEILADPDVKNEDIVFFMNYYKSVNEDGEKQTDEDLVSTLIARTFLPIGDPDRITDTDQIYAFVQDGLTVTDANRIAGVFNNENSVLLEGEKALRAITRKSVSDSLRGTSAILGLKDPIGNRLYNQWQVESLGFVESTLAANPETNPNEFYDPNSKLWLGHLAEKYQRTPGQILRDTFSGMGVPQQAGEQSKVKASDYSDDKVKGLKELQKAYEDGKISLFDRNRIAREKGWGK